jgi:hypothetical protein
MAQNPNAMDVSDGGYDTDATDDTILVGDGDDGYTSEEIRQINEYYDELDDDQMTLTPPRINRGANANDNTHRTPPTQLLRNNNQMPGEVYKMVIQQDGTLRLVPFTSDDYRTGQQPFDINGHAINRDELPHIQPRRLFEEKEGGTSKSRRRRSKRSRRTKKSLRKRRMSRKRKTSKRRKSRSKK